jgi:hypothetical protein
MANKKETALKIVKNITWQNWEHEEDNLSGKMHYSTNEVLQNRLEWLSEQLCEDQTEELDTVWMLGRVLELVDIDEISKS